jgi:hypothetical protein
LAELGIKFRQDSQEKPPEAAAATSNWHDKVLVHHFAAFNLTHNITPYKKQNHRSRVSRNAQRHRPRRNGAIVHGLKLRALCQ